MSCRLVSLSGDMEENPGSSDHCSANTSSVSLLETRLCELHRTALDVGGGGAFFFRAVSHQLYGNPHNLLHVHSPGVHHLLHDPEQFDYSWQVYLLSNVSCQRTRADAIIIEAVANSFNLLIHIAKSN